MKIKKTSYYIIVTDYIKGLRDIDDDHIIILQTVIMLFSPGVLIAVVFFPSQFMQLDFLKLLAVGGAAGIILCLPSYYSILLSRKPNQANQKKLNSVVALHISLVINLLITSLALVIFHLKEWDFNNFLIVLVLFSFLIVPLALNKVIRDSNKLNK